MLMAALSTAAPPASGIITAKSGDWAATFDSGRAWSLHHLDFQGETVAHEKGAQCASVDSGVPGADGKAGWVGGTNNIGGKEIAESLEILVDDQAVEFENKKVYEGAKVTVRRQTTLLNLKQLNEVTVTKDGLANHVRLEAVEDQPIKGFYGAMFNWQKSFDKWAGFNQGKLSQGDLAGSVTPGRGASWIAVFDSSKKRGLVTRLDQPLVVGGQPALLLISCAAGYQKQILDIKGGASVAKGTVIEFTLITGGVTAEPDQWVEAVAKLAGTDLKQAVALAPTEAGPVGMIVAKTRDWTVAFDAERAWTIHHTEFRGRQASHSQGFHGAVINTGITAAGEPGVGWIGTGHTEGGREQVKEVKLELDGQPVALEAGKTYAGRTFKLVKDSQMGQLKHHAELTVADDRITEHHQFEASDDQKIATMYAFMHCWEPRFTRYAAELADGTMVAAEFETGPGNDAKGGKQQLCKDAKWSAIFDEATGTGMVTAYPEVYPAQSKGSGTHYWDLQRYHKQYLNIHGAGTIPKGWKLDCTLVLQGFEAKPDTWVETAGKLARAAFN